MTLAQHLASQGAYAYIMLIPLVNALAAFEPHHGAMRNSVKSPRVEQARRGRHRSDGTEPTQQLWDVMKSLIEEGGIGDDDNAIDYAALDQPVIL